MKKRLEALLGRAIDKARQGGRLKLDSLPPLFFEVPKDAKFGDLASTVALNLAREAGQAPRAIAETIRSCMDDPDGDLAGVEIAGPGYLNFRFSQRFWSRCLADVARPDYARFDTGRGHKVLVEFVSANPTGPLHVGHGRGAVLGDVLVRLLEATGYEVRREYYVNDAGKQMATLGRSMLARLCQVYGEDTPVPEDGYPGEYLREFAARKGEELVAELARVLESEVPPHNDVPAFLHAAEDTALEVCGTSAGLWLLDQIKVDLEALRVEFDDFVSERAMRADGAVDAALRVLEQKDLLYEADGARWFRSSSFGDEKDRVVRRSDGELTYFAGDIAYHRQKMERGYDTLIDIWGADHHGYVGRVAAAMRALGEDAERFRVVLVQIVRLTRAGQPVRMGKRTGEFVSVKEVVEEVGADAARFFYLMRRADSHLDFDLDLAKKQSAENPVFYVQYAHARICSLFAQAEEGGIQVPSADEADVELLTADAEQEVVRLVASFPDVVEGAARELEPHRLVFHLVELAGAFHRFYNRHRVLGVEEGLCRARLYLAWAVRRVVRIGLGLLGVNAPESM